MVSTRRIFPGSHREIAPGTPLPLRLAALAVGCRVRRAEAAAMTEPFLDALASERALRRESDDPGRLAVAIDARDNGDAPDARLEAIEALRGKPPVRPTPRKPRQLMAKGTIIGASDCGPPIDCELTLAEAGIDKHLADRARKAAALPEADFEDAEGFFPAPWLEKDGRVPPPAPPAAAPPVPGTLNAHPMYREPAFKGPSQPVPYRRPGAIRVAPRLGQHR